MSQKLKLKQKKKKVQTQKAKESAKSKVALHALQKQLQILNLREALILGSFIMGAALLRIPMQAIPSVEPITFFALLAGSLFGKKKGFAVGAGALLASNFFVLGGHGPWTLFQALGFGFAGYVGGFLNEKSGYLKAILAGVAATLIFEFVLNISSLLIFPAGFLVFLTALPFTLVHIVSNAAFAAALPKARRFVYEKGQFNEKALCNELIAKFKSARIMSRKSE